MKNTISIKELFELFDKYDSEYGMFPESKWEGDALKRWIQQEYLDKKKGKANA